MMKNNLTKNICNIYSGYLVIEKRNQNYKIIRSTIKQLKLIKEYFETENKNTEAFLNSLNDVSPGYVLIQGNTYKVKNK